MSFSEKVAAFSQSASNLLYSFAESAKETMIKAGTYISETSSKVYAAVLPHFQRFKEASVKFFQDNKTSIGFVAIGLGIGATIGSAIACLVQSKSQEKAKEDQEDPKVVLDANKKPAGGVKVLPEGKPALLKKDEPKKSEGIVAAS